MWRDGNTVNDGAFMKYRRRGEHIAEKVKTFSH